LDQSWARCCACTKRRQQIGGVPEEILYDRMRRVWLGTDERGEIGVAPSVQDFARYWGSAALCRPYRAQTKGKWNRE